MLDKTDRLTDRQIDRQMKGHYIIGNIDVGLGKFCRNDTLFL